MYPGADYAGEISLADIGFPGKALTYVGADTFYYTNEGFKQASHKKKRRP